MHLLRPVHIDACNNIMDNLDLPRGLIGYDSQRNQDLQATGRPLRFHFIRPRTIVYAVVFAAICGLMVWGLLSRSTVEVNVLHDRNPVFVTLSDGSIRNGYTIRVLNKTRQEKVYKLSFDGLGYATMSVVGQEDSSAENIARLTAAPNSVATYHVFLTVPPELEVDETHAFAFTLTDRDGGAIAHHETIFRGP